MFSQQQLLKMLLPVFRDQGELYEKHLKVRARRADAGEKVITNTSDGKETENIAEEGDMLVENQTRARERYLVSRKGFKQRYVKISDEAGGWASYRPLGVVVAVELTQALTQKLGVPGEFTFMASWGSRQIAKEGDFLVCPPNYSQVYRVARQEFFETYRLQNR